MSRLRPIWLLAGGTAVVAMTVGVGGYVLVKPYMAPADFEGAGSGTVTVKIEEGATAGEIASILANAGVVASARSFIRVTEEQAKGNSLRPGHFRLRKGMSAAEALKLLTTPGSRLVRRVTVPEGLRLSEVLDRLAAGTGLRRDDFAKAAQDRQELDLPAYAKEPEGFLFPATYEVEPDMTPTDVLASMVERYKHAAAELDLEAKAAERHLTPLEAVTVASLLQAEGGRDSDYPKIARVIYNRIKARVPLQIDSTVLYAQRRRSMRVTVKDTKVKSPYNTYLHPGLPPGPIANPGEKALRAALHPDQGDWFWFVTTDPEHRITKFTDKESEFVRYREELNRYLGTR